MNKFVSFLLDLISFKPNKSNLSMAVFSAAAMSTPAPMESEILCQKCRRKLYLEHPFYAIELKDNMAAPDEAFVADLGELPIVVFVCDREECTSKPEFVAHGFLTPAGPHRTMDMRGNPKKQTTRIKSWETHKYINN